MTKEEIQRVLDLALEYYKSEIFGTDKESEKPSSERIDWIYDKMKGSSEVPKELKEASDAYAELHGFRVPYDGSNNFYDEVDVKASKEGFVAGSKWQYQKDRGEFAKIKAKTWSEGFDACKEQMMKDAVELELKDNVNYPSDWNQVGMVGLYFYTSPTFKFGDKVKVIIVKEEN